MALCAGIIVPASSPKCWARCGMPPFIPRPALLGTGDGTKRKATGVELDEKKNNGFFFVLPVAVVWPSARVHLNAWVPLTWSQLASHPAERHPLPTPALRETLDIWVDFCNAAAFSAVRGRVCVLNDNGRMQGPMPAGPVRAAEYSTGSTLRCGDPRGTSCPWMGGV